MSKSSELDRKVKVYLLNVLTDMSDEKPDMNINESIKYCKKRFMGEYGWAVPRMGNHRALTEWLQGLAINIAFYNCDILKLAVEWGSIPENYTEKQADKILEDYFEFMAIKLGQLFTGYRVPKELTE